MNDAHPCRKTCARCGVPATGKPPSLSISKQVRKTTHPNVSTLTFDRRGERGLIVLPGGAPLFFQRASLPISHRRHRMTSSGSRKVQLAITPASRNFTGTSNKISGNDSRGHSYWDPAYLLAGDVSPATPNPSPQLLGEGLQDSRRLDCRRA